MPGGTIYYKIYVANTGDTTDDYLLTIPSADNVLWGPTIRDNSFTDVAPSTYVMAQLRVPIPAGTPLGTQNTITIRLTVNGGPTYDNYITITASQRLRPSYQDTYIRIDQPSTPQDSAKPETAYVGTYTGYAERGYFQFDLRGIAPDTVFDDNHPVILATLCYQGWPNGGDQGIYDLYWVENDNWAEENVTWNNNPGYDNLISQTHITGLPYYTGCPVTWLYWKVTGAAENEFKHGDNILSLCLKLDDEGYGGSLSLRTKQCTVPDYWPFLAIGGRAVDVGITPSQRWGFKGGVLNYTVTVKNSDLVEQTENYNLTVSDNAHWGDNIRLENSRFVNVAAEASVTTNLAVTLPDNAPFGVDNYDKINITVKSDDNAVTGGTYCYASVSDNLRPADDDVFVASGKPDNNLNDLYTWSSISVQSFTENNKNCRAFVKFDLSGIPLSLDNYITMAKLNLRCWATTGDDMDMQCFAVDNDNWDEHSITWNNKPAFNDGCLLDTQTVENWPNDSTNSWVSFDVTPWIANQRKYGDNMASFCLKAAVENTSGNYMLDSHEWKTISETPHLYIEYGPTITRGVSASISPVHRIGDNGITENYTINVINMGNAIDDLTLENSDNTQPWPMSITPNSFTNVKPGENRTATLSVVIPSDAAPGSVDNIKVTASGTGVTDNKYITASVKEVDSWVVAGYAPDIENYGVAVTGAGNSIYVATSNSYVTRANFMRYDNTAGGQWTFLAAPEVLRTDNASSPLGYSYRGISNFKNGTALAWDKGNYIYALLGGSYEDNAGSSRARHYFFRYSIDNNRWDNLAPTGNTLDNANNLGAQGPGDALAVVGNYVYAIVGNRYIGSSFWKYTIASNSWTQLSLPAAWNIGGIYKTDDGCSLVWTGGNYLYAFQGQAITVDNSFYRYDMRGGGSWTKMADAPSGVDDGGSLLWLAGDNVYALLGGNPNESIRDNCFYVYSQSGDSWTQLENLPQGIGDPNGQRMGGTGNKYIYVWRGAANPTSEYNPVLWVYTHVTVARGVSVLISPLSQENKNGCPVTFTVTVNNTGSYIENFQLAKGDNAGWTLALDNDWLLVPNGEGRTTNLTVNIPSDATGCTWDNIWVQATSKDNTAVFDNESCLAHVAVVRSVSVSISPSSQENENGGTLAYTVTVKNTGNCFQENFQLAKGDNAGWTLALDNDWLLVPKGENRTTKLNVTIPSSATGCTWDNIWVQATSKDNTAVFDNKSCLAHVAVVMEQFSLHLVAGWNLVGFPLESADATPNKLFAGTTFTMYQWAAPYGPYSGPNKNLPVEDNRGYWVKENQDITITYSGIRSHDNDDLTHKTMYFVAGWNLVCFPWTNENTTPNKIFAGITFTMYQWAAPYGPYSGPNKNLPIEDNRGYWVKVNQNYSVKIPPL